MLSLGGDPARVTVAHVYVHVPFCARRCSYCDFSIAVRKSVPVAEYLAALQAELEVRFHDLERSEVQTIYFGGGTPSRLGGAGMAGAVEIVSRYFPPLPDAEITIEANPEDISAESARRWRRAGINRVSLGAQSFDDSVLEWMHRSHGSPATASAVDVLRGEGITNLSLDLIFALPHALNRNLQKDLERLLVLAPEHISTYGLTVEANTPLHAWVARGITTEIVDDGYEEEFLLVHSVLSSAGYEHYEVSNYSRPGRRSRHNSCYWAGVPYVGLGPSAHGFQDGIRRWNARAYTAWRDMTRAGHDPRDGGEVLTSDNLVAEAVYLVLRTTEGLALLPGDEPLTSRWEAAGWVTIDANMTARCTPTGWLRLDALAAALTHHRSR